jgi:hypothetical protein
MTASDRVSKLARCDASGEPVIPLSLHEQKIEGQARTLWRESVNMWEVRARPLGVLQEQFVMEAFLQRRDVFSKDKARVFDTALVLCAHDYGFAVWAFQALWRHLFRLHNAASARDFSSLGFKLFTLSRTCTSACLVYGVSLNARNMVASITWGWQDERCKMLIPNSNAAFPTCRMC